MAFSTHAARHKIFLIDSGIIPKYAGYVPGKELSFYVLYESLSKKTKQTFYHQLLVLLKNQRRT